VTAGIKKRRADAPTNGKEMMEASVPWFRMALVMAIILLLAAPVKVLAFTFCP
jgi:hypothetical protein